MNHQVEIHPGEGGDDATRFADELGAAIARHTNGTATSNGRVVTVEAPHRL